ncbi:patatin-like phospholipase [Rhizoctonia solani AG-3 Rhs1AP]|nr:patatin-like phospholipase [Rhizoctonia solani AG-3 Rhs1AP]KEP45188.1 patatin-like phospholipase [Rhizoctonia solani 123E]
MDSDLNPRPLRILCIDGAGIRSYSSLIILQQLMARLPTNPAEPPVRPAQIFDLIIGTGAGGIIALMLGRLRMSVPECLTHFQEIMLDLLGRSMAVGLLSTVARALKGRDLSWLSSSKLQAHSKRIISLSLGSPDTLMYEGGWEDNICRTAVVASKVNAGPIILRSYKLESDDSDEELKMDQVQIWEAARATSATPMIFEPIFIGGRDSYVDGAVAGHSNPAQLALDEVEKIWPEHPIGLFLSLGTGVSSVGKQVAAEQNSIFDVITSSAARIEHQVQVRIERDFTTTSYIRFCPGEELASVSLGDHTAITGNHSRVHSITVSYLLQPQQINKMTRCAELMTRQLSIQASSPEEMSWGSLQKPSGDNRAHSPLKHTGVSLETTMATDYFLSTQQGLGSGQSTPTPVEGSRLTPSNRGGRSPQAMRRISVSKPRTDASESLAPGNLTRGSRNSLIAPMPTIPQFQIGSSQVELSALSHTLDSPEDRSAWRVPEHTGVSYGSPPYPFRSASAGTLSPTLPLHSHQPLLAQLQPTMTGHQSLLAQRQPEDTPKSETSGTTGLFRNEISSRPAENIIATGTYTLNNIHSGNEAALEDANHESSLVGASSDCDFAKIWNIEKLSNGKYTIKSVQHANFASHESRPKADSHVYGKKDSKQWVIQESKIQNEFTIRCIEDDLFWGLVDAESKTPIQLRKVANDKKNHWRFDPAIIPDQPAGL